MRKYAIIGLAIVLAAVGIGLCIEGFEHSLIVGTDMPLRSLALGYTSLGISLLLFIIGAFTNN